MPRVVTIDGPAGAGKSTVARLLAGRLGWRLLDTGAMFRAVAFAAIREGVDLDSDEALGLLAGLIEVRLPAGGEVLLDGEDVADSIRSPEVTRATGRVADKPAVRRRLADWQRAFAAESDTVTEGRDQGTVVFPLADRKFFLTASIEERARRRHAEFAAKGGAIALESVLADIKERDERDSSRAIAPLRPAADATVLDTSDLEPDRIVDILERTIRSLTGPDPRPDGPRP